MKKKFAYTLLSVGLVWLLFHAILSPLKPLTADKKKTVSPETSVIIAPAIIDSLSDITRIPSLQSGLLKSIHAAVGDKVKKGQPLFSLDDTFAENNYRIQQITRDEAQNELLIQEKALKHVQLQLERLKKIDQRAVVKAELREKIHEVNMGKIKTEQARQRLELAAANLTNAQRHREQYTVFAPTDGIILQINAHLNEWVNASQTVMLLADAEKVIVRVSLDEHDTHYFNPKAQAYLTSLENTSIKIPLTFVQLEKFIVTQERLNSRVQEIIYSFNRETYPSLVAGQQFDANITVRRL